MQNKEEVKLMIEYDSKLNNFFGGVVVKSLKRVKLSNVPERRFAIRADGKFHEIDPLCPRCDSMDVVDNGNDKCKSKIVRKFGLVIKRGKCKCNSCGNTWTVRCKDVERLIQQYKQLIKMTVFPLVVFGVSLDKVVEYVAAVFNEKISYEWVRQLYINTAKTVEQKKVLQTSGIFHYDEQWVKVNGKKYFRVVVLDAVTNSVIFDETVEDSKVETLKDKLRMRMLPYRKEVFIVDLRKGYPDMLKELFPKVKIQWCLFHLNQLIIDDFKASKKLNKYGKKVLPLQELYNQYLMFNPFLNHGVELSFLRRQLKKLDQHKECLKGCGVYKAEDTTLIGFYEMKLIQEFTEFRKGLKKNRKKHKYKYLLRRGKEESIELFEKIWKEITLFPKKVQSRIRKIRKNWDKFTQFQENPLVPPTNNAVEQYYSATMQKTEKKKWRSTTSLNLKLKIAREKWNQTIENLKFNFLNFLQLFAKIHYFFAPT